MLKILFTFLALLISGFSIAQSDSLLRYERDLQRSIDDAEQRDSVVSLNDYSLDAGSALGKRSYFAVRFGSLPITSDMDVNEAKIRFVVANPVDEVVIQINMEKTLDPRDYNTNMYDISVRQPTEQTVWWSLRDLEEGDTIYTPNLAKLIEEVAAEFSSTGYYEYSFLFGPEWAVNDTAVKELSVYSINQLDTNRSAKFSMELDAVYGVDEIDATQINIFPNPASSVLNVQLGSESFNQATLIDLSGRTIQSTIISNRSFFEWQVDGIPSGIYLLQLSGENGILNRQVFIN